VAKAETITIAAIEASGSQACRGPEVIAEFHSMTSPENGAQVGDVNRTSASKPRRLIW
jgi:hypothetical protein